MLILKIVSSIDHVWLHISQIQRGRVLNCTNSVWILFPRVFTRSQRWQGFEDHSFKQIPQHFLSKKKKLAEKEKARRAPSLPEQSHPLEGPLQAESNSPQANFLNMGKQTCSLRTPIGIITSPLPRGRWGSCFLQKPHDNVLAVLVIYVEEFLLLHGFKFLQSRFISISQDELWQHCTVCWWVYVMFWTLWVCSYCSVCLYCTSSCC